MSFTNLLFTEPAKYLVAVPECTLVVTNIEHLILNATRNTHFKPFIYSTTICFTKKVTSMLLSAYILNIHILDIGIIINHKIINSASEKMCLPQDQHEI